MQTPHEHLVISLCPTVQSIALFGRHGQGSRACAAGFVLTAAPRFMQQCVQRLSLPWVQLRQIIVASKAI